MHDLDRALQEFESGTDTMGSYEFAQQGEMESDYEGESYGAESEYEGEGYEGEGDYEAGSDAEYDAEGEYETSGVYEAEAQYEGDQEGAPRGDDEAVFDEIEEMEQAAALLEVQDEAELDQFLTSLVSKVKKKLKKVIPAERAERPRGESEESRGRGAAEAWSGGRQLRRARPGRRDRRRYRGQRRKDVRPRARGHEPRGSGVRGRQTRRRTRRRSREGRLAGAGPSTDRRRRRPKTRCCRPPTRMLRGSRASPLEPARQAPDAALWRRRTATIRPVVPPRPSHHPPWHLSRGCPTARERAPRTRSASAARTARASQTVRAARNDGDGRGAVARSAAGARAVSREGRRELRARIEDFLSWIRRAGTTVHARADPASIRLPAAAVQRRALGLRPVRGRADATQRARDRALACGPRCRGRRRARDSRTRSGHCRR